MIAKLDGTFRIRIAEVGTAVEVTDLQQSIFNAPVPGSSAAPISTSVGTGIGLPSKPPGGADHLMNDAATPESRGQKRPRDEEEEEEDDSEGDVAMEEDSGDESD
jgi:U2 small nuclear ribonucleoprotein B''